MRDSMWHTSSDRGPRRTNADAVASFADPRTGLVAFALADGIGDDGTAARLAASAAVRAAGDGAEAAMAAARRAVETTDSGDCVLVLAVPHSEGYEIAWVGDARAYAVVGDTVRQLTTDHTLAQYFRDRGTPATPRMEHLVTASVRTAKPGQIGYASVRTPSYLVLTSDGVHRHIDPPTLAGVLSHAPDPATELVRLAGASGSGDNATALVVHCAPVFLATVAIPVAA